MSKNIVSVGEEIPVEEIARMMTTHHIKRLPVMNGGKVIGIVSRADIVSAIALGKHVALHTPVYDLYLARCECQAFSTLIRHYFEPARPASPTAVGNGTLP